MSSDAARRIDAELDAIGARAEEVLESLRAYVHKVDHFSYSELAAIGRYVGKTRQEISALGPAGISQRRIPQAGAELDAMVRDSAAAADQIMTAAEALLAHESDDLEAYRAFVCEQAMVILEACGFHDINGQRISKVVDVLKVIESRTHRFATELGLSDELGADGDVAPAGLINGPALDTGSVDQSSIDDLFASTPRESAA